MMVCSLESTEKPLGVCISVCVHAHCVTFNPLIQGHLTGSYFFFLPKLSDDGDKLYLFVTGALKKKDPMISLHSDACGVFIKFWLLII